MITVRTFFICVVAAVHLVASEDGVTKRQSRSRHVAPSAQYVERTDDTDIVLHEPKKSAKSAVGRHRSEELQETTSFTPRKADIFSEINSMFEREFRKSVDEPKGLTQLEKSHMSLGEQGDDAVAGSSMFDIMYSSERQLDPIGTVETTPRASYDDDYSTEPGPAYISSIDRSFVRPELRHIYVAPAFAEYTTPALQGRLHNRPPRVSTTSARQGNQLQRPQRQNSPQGPVLTLSEDLPYEDIANLLDLSASKDPEGPENIPLHFQQNKYRSNQQPIQFRGLVGNGQTNQASFVRPSSNNLRSVGQNPGPRPGQDGSLQNQRPPSFTNNAIPSSNLRSPNVPSGGVPPQRQNNHQLGIRQQEGFSNARPQNQGERKPPSTNEYNGQAIGVAKVINQHVNTVSQQQISSTREPRPSTSSYTERAVNKPTYQQAPNQKPITDERLPSFDPKSLGFPLAASFKDNFDFSFPSFPKDLPGFFDDFHKPPPNQEQQKNYEQTNGLAGPPYQNNKIPPKPLHQAHKPHTQVTSHPPKPGKKQKHKGVSSTATLPTVYIPTGKPILIPTQVQRPYRNDAATNQPINRPGVRAPRPTPPGPNRKRSGDQKGQRGQALSRSDPRTHYGLSHPDNMVLPSEAEASIANNLTNDNSEKFVSHDTEDIPKNDVYQAIENNLKLQHIKQKQESDDAEDIPENQNEDTKKELISQREKYKPAQNYYQSEERETVDNTYFNTKSDSKNDNEKEEVALNATTQQEGSDSRAGKEQVYFAPVDDMANHQIRPENLTAKTIDSTKSELKPKHDEQAVGNSKSQEPPSIESNPETQQTREQDYANLASIYESAIQNGHKLPQIVQKKSTQKSSSRLERQQSSRTRKTQIERPATE